MITCHVKYIIDPYHLHEFENYASKWIEIVELMGGIHHGYFLPSEGANNIAYCLFSIDSLT